MIPTEDNYVDWILAGIHEYFARIGFAVRTFSVGQVKEKDFPVDRLLALGSKLIGLQFKRPLRESPPWEYDTRPHQHQDILGSNWVYYCLPDFTDMALDRVALFHCKFVRGREIPIEGLRSARYYRWGAIAQGLQRCGHGVQLKSSESWDDLIEDIVSNPRDAYLLISEVARGAFIVAERDRTSRTGNGAA